MKLKIGAKAALGFSVMLLLLAIMSITSVVSIKGMLEKFKLKKEGFGNAVTAGAPAGRIPQLSYAAQQRPFFRNNPGTARIKHLRLLSWRQPPQRMAWLSRKRLFP